MQAIHMRGVTCQAEAMLDFTLVIILKRIAGEAGRNLRAVPRASEPQITPDEINGSTGEWRPAGHDAFRIIGQGINTHKPCAAVPPPMGMGRIRKG